jgi:hypothetical protein
MEQGKTDNRKEADMKLYINVYKSVKTGHLNTESHCESFDDATENLRENDRNEWEYVGTMLPAMTIITQADIDDLDRRVSEERKDKDGVIRVTNFLARGV